MTIYAQLNFPMLRRTKSNKSRRQSKSPCVVVLSDKQYLDHHSEEQPVECELQADDILGEKKYKMVKVKGLGTKWAEKNKIESGVTTLFASNSVIDDDSNELIIPTGETIQVSQRDREPASKNNSNTLGTLVPISYRSLDVAIMVTASLVRVDPTAGTHLTLIGIGTLPPSSRRS